MHSQTIATTPAALPPGPPCRFFGFPELFRLGRDYLGHLSRLQRRYGDVVYMRFGSYRDYSFFHPEHLRELLLGSHEQMIRWERATEVFAAVHGHSVLVAEGAAWSEKRRMLQPGFGPKRVVGFAAAMVAAGSEGLASWHEQAQLDLDFEQAMTHLTMDVILRTLFSSSATAEARLAEDAVRVLSIEGMREMYWPKSAPLWAPWKAGKRHAMKALDGLIRGHIAARRGLKGAAPDDLLNMLMQLRHEDGQALSDTELRDECMTIFLAGHETSAAALTWWGWCMAANPAAAALARAEVDRVLTGRTPCFDDLAALPYLTQTIKETLRLYPAAPALMSRRTTAAIEIAGLTVPAGALIRLTPGVTQRDARWFPEPESFKPERFAADAAEIPRGAYLPFGAGPRVCLGSHFAQTEISLIAALLLQRFELQRIPGSAAPEPVLHITLRPKQALRLRLLRRADGPRDGEDGRS
ncbi:cytochrome P450 [Paucibacter sp. TC2R-5]|uniref:cytochrome P450 n=1 Tax=Paucibacter sp. TC2R-5 TaxID=2893555 RepID=UPI0021E46A8A|nr:cytochrome P450 [Paucibacter sp. TC2R-5]MCV2358148.1 cytochrome P450 [Paucibacter sp. TC2R-5]